MKQGARGKGRGARGLLFIALCSISAFGFDGGIDAGSPLSDEDREIVENLELLENLHEAAELDTLLDLLDEPDASR